MRTSPTVQVSLRRFAAWRVAVALLTGLGLAAQVAWALTHEIATRPAMLAAGVGVCVALLLVGASLARVEAMSLRWDGLAWHAGAAGSAEADGVEGHVAVVLDLGAWMLLRFTPAAPKSRRGVTWLPAQRRGLEAQWHALRCAVHSPRPTPASSATAPGP